MKKKLIKPSASEDLAITKAARSDIDNRPITKKDWDSVKSRVVRGRGRPIGSGTKEQITLRIDKDTLQFFKSKGDGWQTFINLVLGEIKRESKSIKTIEKRLNAGKLIRASWILRFWNHVIYLGKNKIKGRQRRPINDCGTTLLLVAVSTKDAQESQEVGENVVDA